MSQQLFGTLVILLVPGFILTSVHPRSLIYLFIISIPLESLVVIQGTTFSRFLGVAALISWMVYKVSQRKSSPPRHIQILPPILLLVIVNVVLALQAVSSDRFVTQFMTLAQLAVFAFLIIDSMTTWESLESAIKALFVGGVIAVILVLFQANSISLPYLASADISSVGPTIITRAGQDISGNENATAAYLVAMLPLGFYFLRASPTRIWRVLGAMYVVLAPIAVIYSYSRLNIAMLVPVFGASLWNIIPKHARAERLRTVAIVSIAIIIIFIITPWNLVSGRFGELNNVSTDNVFSDRIYIWKVALFVFSNHPFTGVGYGNFGSYAYYYEYNQAFGSYSNVNSSLSPHSSFLGILAETGIIGLLSWLPLFFVSVKQVLPHANDEGAQASLRQTVLLMLITLIVLGTMGTTHNTKLLWFVLGVSEAYWQLGQSQPVQVRSTALRTPV